MSTKRTPTEFTDAREAGEDLSEKVGYLVHMETDGVVELAVAQEIVAGVVIEGATAGKSCTFQHGGLASVVSGAGIIAGNKVESDALGRAVQGTTNAFGTAMTSVPSAGMMVEVQLG